MILGRYIIRTLLLHMLTVLAALLALITVFNFLEQLDDVGVGSYTVIDAALHAAMLVPAWLTDFAPIAAFLGALTGLGRLQQDSELTAMRAAGWSMRRMALVAMVAGALLSVSAALAGEYVAPGLAQTAARMKAERRFGPGVSSASDAWWTLDGSRIVGIDQRPGFPAVTLIGLDPAGNVVVLGEATGIRSEADGSATYLGYRETRYSSRGASGRRLDALAERGAAVTSLLRLSEGTPRFASLRELVAREHQLHRAALDNSEALYQVHERIARVITAPLLVALAVPFVLGVLRSSRQGARLVAGLAIGFALSIAQDVSHSLVMVLHAPPVPLAWVPALLTVAAGLVMARSMRPRRIAA